MKFSGKLKLNRFGDGKNNNGLNYYKFSACVHGLLNTVVFAENAKFGRKMERIKGFSLEGKSLLPPVMQYLS